MSGEENTGLAATPAPQCQFFVQRKKRLCRMTVKPGRQYCGEHEPQPTAEAGQTNKRIPCPNDPKHTVYASKLLKHLAICNARPTEQPPYIQHNINAPEEGDDCPRRPLSAVSAEELAAVVDKINRLYAEHVEGQITEQPSSSHRAVAAELAAAGRAESSRRHLRQVAALLLAAERAGLVRDNTCYVELGAGKGQLSYYACHAWCGGGSGSRVLAVDRAALRHKRDNKLRSAPPRAPAYSGDSDTLARPDHNHEDSEPMDGDTLAANVSDEGSSSEPCAGVAGRVRADLAHLALGAVPAVAGCGAVVGLAKHLCGAATDLALRCVCAAGAARGVVLAACCHHRIERRLYVATRHLQELGITAEEFNIMLGVVSWATCGDGRARGSRGEGTREGGGVRGAGREETGRRAKALLDWGRVLWLRARGYHARLVHYVPRHVSLENTAVVAVRR